VRRLSSTKKKRKAPLTPLKKKKKKKEKKASPTGCRRQGNHTGEGRKGRRAYQIVLGNLKMKKGRKVSNESSPTVAASKRKGERRIGRCIDTGAPAATTRSRSRKKKEGRGEEKDIRASSRSLI